MKEKERNERTKERRKNKTEITRQKQGDDEGGTYQYAIEGSKRNDDNKATDDNATDDNTAMDDDTMDDNTAMDDNKTDDNAAMDDNKTMDVLT
jgi:hypothetical protein